MQPFFLSRENGQRFCIFYPAAGGTSKGAVLYVHPFAEEMNKTRHMVALQSRAMAAAGYDVLQIDLQGCGDSSGDFGDATWKAWREDIFAACSYLRGRSPAPLILWGLRVGCLLVVEIATELLEPADFIFWQPVVSGKQYWQQFMRLKMLGRLAKSQPEGRDDPVRQNFASGGSVEISGYSLSPEMVSGLAQSELLPPSLPGRVAWFELSMRDEANLAPLSQKMIERWREAGFEVEASMVRAPGFWQTAEIEDVPKLLSLTLAALEFKR